MRKTYRTLELIWLVFFVVCLIYGMYEAFTEGFTDHTKLLFLGAFMALTLFVIRRTQRIRAGKNEQLPK